MKVITVFYLLVLISCVESTKEKKPILTSEYSTGNSKIKNSADTLSTQELMSLTKSKAIKKYGKPSSNEQFTLDDAQGEFRNSISDKYSEKERQSESILIKEVTWEKDKITWITVWYEVREEESLPKDVLLWEKGSEF